MSNAGEARVGAKADLLCKMTDLLTKKTNRGEGRSAEAMDCAQAEQKDRVEKLKQNLEREPW